MIYAEILVVCVQRIKKTVRNERVMLKKGKSRVKRNKKSENA